MMPDYHKMYLKMAQAAGDAAELNRMATDRLIKAMQEAENIFIEADDTPLRIVPLEQPKSDEGVSG